MRVIIYGDSHTVKLQSAFAEDPSTFENIIPGRLLIGKLFSFPEVLEPFVSENSEGIVFTNERAAERYFRLTGDRYIRKRDGDVHVLSLFFTTTILIRSTCWRTHLPAEIADRPKSSVSEAVMEAIVLHHFRYAIDFARAFMKRGIPLLALEAPPPRGDDRTLARHLKPNEALTIDHIARDVMRRTLTELSVGIIEMPTWAASAPGGFLDERFQADAKNDFHHANSTLGAAVLRDALSSAGALVARQ